MCSVRCRTTCTVLDVELHVKCKMWNYMCSIRCRMSENYEPEVHKILTTIIASKQNSMLLASSYKFCNMYILQLDQRVEKG
jgi:hypothetical protein